MKSIGKILLGLGVLAMMMSCSSGYEAKGDDAYKIAQRLQGEQKRYQQKMAYMMYGKAIQSKPTKVSPKLRNRYVEMTLVRANTILSEGAANASALILFMEDLDKQVLIPDVSPELKQKYAMFLMQYSDSSISNEKYVDAISILDKAIGIANDKSPVETKKTDLMKKIAKDNLDMADIEFQTAKADKDVEAYIKAEYYALASLMYDSTNAEARKLLTTVRKENISTYSAYVRVIETIPDSAIFRSVNKWDILLAIPTFSQKGKGASAVVTIYNNSWNPLRMNSPDFKLVNTDGREFPAAVTRLEPEMLDQQRETKCKLTFPGASGKIAKLIYRNGEHYSEKCFM